TVCCFAYSKLQIPRSFVASAYTTSSSCALPAVVLVTQKGHQLCVDPQALWVQAYLKHLQMLKD
ncbi:CL3L1 protein, partial [Steatornis caripensis]|nr:CL3L1 protein [Steatornis caripensis]